MFSSVILLILQVILHIIYNGVLLFNVFIVVIKTYGEIELPLKIKQSGGLK